ncbi:MAG: DUF4838 domain-containing protein [Verrucomicrobiales bacterium]
MRGDNRPEGDSLTAGQERSVKAAGLKKRFPTHTRYHYRMKFPLLALTFLAALLPAFAAAENFLVKDGRPHAQIIVREDAPRPLELAAEQLQEYVQKISGARLPIHDRIDENIPVKIYVGQSQYTDQLGLDGDQFIHGGFHVKSGDDWLALVGRDRRFVWPKISPRKHSDLPKVYEEWDQASGEKFRYPYPTIWKTHHRELDIHEKDERGSFNATTYFLRSLGVRWYLPDEIGEVVPEKRTIALPEIDKEVRPDFPIRWPNQHARRFGGASQKEALWHWRMGWSQAPEVIGYGNGSHDIAGVTDRDETRKEHPEYYALLENGERDHIKQCLSSEGLFQANLRYIKALDQVFGDKFVQVMPADAYTSICKCPLCEGLDTPEKGYRGLLSNYAWEYSDKVAKEIYKTHPDITVSNQAYGTYVVPPDNITKFSPNFVPQLAQHRHDFIDPDKKKTTLAHRQAFIDMLPEGGKIMINEKYRWGNHKPMYYPHIIAEDLKSLKGISLGGIYEVFRSQNKQKRGEGIDWMADMHLNLYVTSMFWWDADQDIEELLGYYYKSFYGPAEKEMKAFIEYSEKNWPSSDRDPVIIGELFTLIDKALNKVEEGSIYAKRVSMVYDHIRPLQEVQAKLAMGREDVPLAYAIKLFKKKHGEITVDGKLDEEVWSKWPTYKLKDLETGGKPEFQTTFKAIWDDGSSSMIFGVKCDEDTTKDLNISAKENDDMAIFAGDVVEIIIETLSHSYYQIAISPNGVMTDLDRKDDIESRWNSEATVATFIGEDFWSLEIEIPVAGENQGLLLPFNGVAGSAPVEVYPWYFNIGRARIRGEDKQVSSFNGEGFHDVVKFGKMHFRVIKKE